jgi:hypothetical protein
MQNVKYKNRLNAKNIIENLEKSDINFSKFGWCKKASKIICKIRNR